MRVRSTPLLAVLASLLAVTAVTAQVSLKDIPELARQRAERSRPRQIAALEPFWADFALDYLDNQSVLDDSIKKASQLGDSVVPLLLEKLRPAQSGSVSLNLAGNCRRVLRYMDPGSFADALAEMARSSHTIGRSQAIMLLGYANVPQSATVLAELLDKVDDSDRTLIIGSLRRLGAPEAAPKIVGLLGSTSRRFRQDILSYLIAARASSVVETVVQALSTEAEDRVLPFYIEYFGTCITNHAGATTVLLPLLSRERIDWQDTKNLIMALATVAPKGHDATIRKLAELIESSDASSLAVQAAVTMRALGDKQGIVRLKRKLDDKIRKRKREAGLFEQRASLLFAIGDFSHAHNDFQKILDYSEGAAMTRRAYEGLLKCEARRNKVQSMIKHMTASGMTPEEFQSLAATDAPFHRAMGHDRTKSFIRQLIKDRRPK
jgi:HEAT repeat protein